MSISMREKGRVERSGVKHYGGPTQEIVINKRKDSVKGGGRSREIGDPGTGEIKK